MKIELKRSTIEVIGGDDQTEWFIDKGDGIVLININKLMSNPVIECDWLDANHQFIEVFYSAWDGSELWAIIDTHGNLLREGIRSIETFLGKERLIIVEMSGFGMGDDAREFGLESDDWKMAVINRYGNFVIPPEYNQIWFDEVEKLFYGKKSQGIKYQFSVKGELLNQS